MADELDLERGDPARAEERRARRTARRAANSSGETKTEAKQIDTDLHSHLIEAFDQIVEWRVARDDEELATAIEEDKEKMAKGLVSLTHTVEPLRRPLVIFLGFVQPVLAFGRIGRILAGRWFTRRQRQAEELAAQQAEWDAQNDQAAAVVS